MILNKVQNLLLVMILNLIIILLQNITIMMSIIKIQLCIKKMIIKVIANLLIQNFMLSVIKKLISFMIKRLKQMKKLKNLKL